MNRRNIYLLLIAVVFSFSSSLMAQSKTKQSKNTKAQVVDAKSAKNDDTEKDEEKVTTYVILDLFGKNGDYSAQMLIPKSNQEMVISEQTITAEKKAAYAAQRSNYPTEIDFIKAMRDQMLELVAVTKEVDERGEFKRFYFRREVVITN